MFQTEVFKQSVKAINIFLRELNMNKYPSRLNVSTINVGGVVWSFHPQFYCKLHSGILIIGSSKTKIKYHIIINFT